MGKASKQFIAVGLGEVLWDLLPAGKQLGGAPANFAYHAQALGARGVVVSAVGKDELGRELLERLGACDLDVGFVALDEDHATGTVSVNVDEEGNPEYVIHEGVAWDFVPATRDLLSLAGSCDAVCFGSLAQRSPGSRETIHRFLDSTRPGCLRVFDINLRQPYFDADVIRESLERADVLKLNDEELPVVAELLSLDGPEPEVVNGLIEDFGLRAIALTRGEHGSVLHTRDEELVHAGCAVAEVVDTVGAGDCFSACLAMGLLRGEPLAEIGARANYFAGYVCSQEGAMPAMNIDCTDA